MYQITAGAHNNTFQNQGGKDDRSSIEEVYSYIHDDSASNWKRNSSKPIFAEESFPLKKRINPNLFP